MHDRIKTSGIRKVNEVPYDELVRALKESKTHKQAAVLLGVSVRGLRSRLKDDPPLRAIYGSESVIDIPDDVDLLDPDLPDNWMGPPAGSKLTEKQVREANIMLNIDRDLLRDSLIRAGINPDNADKVLPLGSLDANIGKAFGLNLRLSTGSIATMQQIAVEQAYIIKQCLDPKSTHYIYDDEERREWAKLLNNFLETTGKMADRIERGNAVLIKITKLLNDKQRKSGGGKPGMRPANTKRA